MLLNVALFGQEQLREREQAVHELERKMEEKDRELHAIKLDNEAVCWVLAYFWYVLYADEWAISINSEITNIDWVDWAGLG